MGRRTLERRINRKFRVLGMKDSWLHQSFKELYELDQLVHFQIFDINWFRGAQEIVDLVDELHSMVTPKEDFKWLARMLEIDYEDNDTKWAIAAKVKSDKRWRVKAFELDRLKKYEKRLAQLEPLYEYLEGFGYRSQDLPEQEEFKHWKLLVSNEYQEQEVLHFQEDEKSRRVKIKSETYGFIGYFENIEHIFVETL